LHGRRGQLPRTTGRRPKRRCSQLPRRGQRWSSDRSPGSAMQTLGRD